MENELNYDNIERLLDNLPDNYKILEETIDIETQKEFFETAQNLDFNTSSIDITVFINQLNDNEISLADKKVLLQKLSMCDSIVAFRAIEAFRINPPKEINDWVILALQQSRMIIQSSLLDEQQVFISTGLGGKNSMLRYFLIFPYTPSLTINSIQKEVLEKELAFFLEQYNGVMEEIIFQTSYATALALIPLDMKPSEMIRDILNECNQFGQFLSENIIITNIKKFKHEQILSIIKKYEQ